MSDPFDSFDREKDRITKHPFDGAADPINQNLEPYDPTKNMVPQNNTSNNINYECPACGGRFRTWEDSGSYTDGEERCPFCYTPKGEHGGDQVQKLREEKRELEENVRELEEKLEEIFELFE